MEFGVRSSESGVRREPRNEYNFEVTGDLVPTATTPEPGSLMGLIGLGCLGLVGKLRKNQ